MNRYFLQITIFLLILAASLFISSGKLDWWMGWIYIAIVAAGNISVALILMIRNPGLMGERAETRGKRDLDRVLAGIMALFGPASICIVAGLNLRNAWLPHVSIPLQVVGIVISVPGSLLTVWAMASNKFFYGVLRIAPEKGHTVCTRGAYRYVRHPGYAGAILFDLVTPLILHSAWAFIPAALTVCAIVLRTLLEDRALLDRLPGYSDYAQRVRYRLLPGVW